MILTSSTRIEVTGHRSDLGRWRAAQRSAEPRLRDYVLGYFATEGFLPSPLNERHLPLREVAIVLTSLLLIESSTHRTRSAQPSTETHGSSLCSIAIRSVKPSELGTLW